MSKRYIRLFGLLAISVIFVGCNRTIDPILPDPLAIYPVDSGSQRTYYVIDTVYESATGPYDALTYYKNERGGGLTTDLLGREVNKLFIYTSQDSTDTMGNPVYQWEYDDLWTHFADDQGAERIEGNTRYQLLKFPIMQGLSWDGNAFNTEDEQTYEYINIDTTVTLNNISYENCVLVMQVPYRTAGLKTGFYIEEYAYEIYAPDIGKIYKYKKDFSQQNPSDIDPESRVYIEMLVEHN